MKFNDILLIVLVLLLNVALSVQTSVKNKSTMRSRSKARSRSRAHSRSKRRQSMMEYVNTFFSDAPQAKLNKKKSESSDDEEENNHAKSQSKKKYRFKETEKRREVEEERESEENREETRVEGKKKKNQDDVMFGRSKIFKIHEKEEEPKPVMEEFFMVSTAAFLDRYRFPPVNIERNKFWTIKTDKNNFRINDSFKKTSNKDKQPNDKFFFFRLSGLNLYYTNTKSDLNILGAISVKSMEKILTPSLDASTDYITTCFVLSDSERLSYKICGMKEKTVKHWYCQIKSFLGEQDMNVCLKDEDGETKVITKTVEITQPIVIVPTASAHCNERWNYQNWGDDWECDCKEGKEQTPIDLPKEELVIHTDVAPLFRYLKIAAKDIDPTVDETYTDPDKKTLRLELKENLLRIFHPDMGRLITVDGAVYSAEEIIIHTPAEHSLNGKKYDMEVSIIHYGITVGDIAKQASLNFLFEKSPGVTNPFLEDLNYFDLPGHMMEKKNIPDMVDINKINVSPEDVGDITSIKPFGFFTYQGSLSFPPCTENTIVYVASKPLKIGSTALQLFQEATRIPDMIDQRGNVIINDWKRETARKTQDVNGRPIFHYEGQDCSPPTTPKPEVGHYEKIRKAMTSYFYVNNSTPSGLPNAYVVSEGEAKGTGIRPKPKNTNNFA